MELGDNIACSVYKKLIHKTNWKHIIIHSIVIIINSIFYNERTYYAYDLTRYIFCVTITMDYVHRFYIFDMNSKQ